MSDHRIDDPSTIGYAYIASPYSNKDSDIMDLRYRLICNITATLLQERIAVFSPIVHCHPLAKVNELSRDAEFWKFYNRTMLRGARELWLLHLDGWEESEGMKGEFEMAAEFGIPFQGVEPSDENIRKLAQRVRELHRT